MGWFLRWILCYQALSSARSFFVDTENPIIFQNNEPSFGHQVAQLEKWVIVSAPRHQQTQNETGQLYSCDPRTASCSTMSIPVFPEDVNISLGLSLAVQQNPAELLVCGPTLRRTCGDNIYVNGRCFHVTEKKRVNKVTPLPKSLPACSIRPLDIVFLIDGSGSIPKPDFTRMLTFVSRVMAAFRESDTQFALMQYSHRFETHFDFNGYSRLRKRDQPIDIVQHIGGTHTSTAILRVMQSLFVAQSGARASAEKVLIVITDGESINDSTPFSTSIAEAERRGVRRFVLGVGDAFVDTDAYQELETIASPPAKDHLLRVSDFSRLVNFQKTLQDKIFAIEGTQSVAGSSFQFEMSQEGFSAILTKNGPILGAVGAHGWSGGISMYMNGQEEGTWITQKDMKDSYMGYAVQQVQWDTVAIGAPRHKHLGSVFIYKRNPRSSSDWIRVASFTADQIGSYFGSVLGVLPVSSSKALLVVGAPTYYSLEALGGRVYLCPVQEVVNRRYVRVTMTCAETLQGDPSQSIGHFGASISVLPDLTGDWLPELAVGAPYEDDYRGAVYIFPGQDESFRTSYIQRIAGQQVSRGIRHFGRSLSGNLDMTEDNLPDLVVGGEGKVLLMRSRPVVGISVVMMFNPRPIPLTFYECSQQRRVESIMKLTLCFYSHRKNTRVKVEHVNQVAYSLLLDAGRTNPRAHFANGARFFNGTEPLLPEVCGDHQILLPECVEDSLTPLRVSLNFSLVGFSVLSEDSPSHHVAEVAFEKNCGGDGLCEDNLSVKTSFVGVNQLVVGLALDVNMTVSVKNEGEDSYNTRVLIPFPSGLSYRMVSLSESNKKVTVACSTLEGQMVVTCGVNRPLLRPNTMATFVVIFHVSPTADLGNSLTLTANVTSDNGQSHTDGMTSSSQLSVRYAVYMTVTSLQDSSKYLNFSTSDSTVRHIYRVRNLGQRPLPLTIVFMVPVRLGETSIWETWNITSSETEYSTCAKAREDPGSEDYKEVLARTPILNCSIAWCVRVECEVRDLEVESSLDFTINGSVTKDWITQTGQKKVFLQSSVGIRYDLGTYSHILEQNERFINAQTQTALEIHVEYNYFPIIIGSCLGALVLLALITAGLYKVGFFKRQHKQMLELPAEQAPLDT